MTATNKTIPGKRLRTWHRNRRTPSASVLEERDSLRTFARNVIAHGTDAEKKIALAWAGGKVAP